MTNIQTSGATLLDTMNQLLVFTEMNNQDNASPERDANSTTDTDTANDESHVNLGTLVEQVIDTISVGHTFKEAHGKDLEMKRKGIVTIRALHNTLAPITTAVTIHPEAAKLVRTDTGAFKRLLMILYSNALNYTSHGHVEVELCLVAEPGQTTERSIQLVVRDSGRGISRRYQDSRMFLPFSQEYPNSAGVGLGLSIAQRVVLNFGGTIDVDSEEGVGTTMKVTIPFTNVLALDAQPETSSVYSPTLLCDHVKGRSICLVNSAERFSNTEAQPEPSIYDSTDNVLARSLKVIPKDCFSMQIVTEAEAPQAALEITRGEVFISSGLAPKTRKAKVQNPCVQCSTPLITERPY